MVNAIIAVLGGLCFLYFLICICYAGVSSTFSFVWLAAAAACGGVLYIGSYFAKHHIEIPGVIKIALCSLVLIGAGIFGYVEGIIISTSHDEPAEEVDYVIVLGAKVDGTRVMKSLARRLDTAYEYLNEHSNTKVIVSGGQGPGEDITEASAMEAYLVEKGLDSNRIIKEDASTNTDENIQFSRNIIQDDTKSVAIVTNSFHLYRAMRIASKQGLVNVSGIAAPTDKILAVSYYTREGLAVLKYKLTGQI
ncbi:MAG: YdcF family protein [bacterium]|nr:YdcF family protein [bacterium]